MNDTQAPEGALRTALEAAIDAIYAVHTAVYEPTSGNSRARFAMLKIEAAKDALAAQIAPSDEVTRLRELAATCYAGLGAECNLPDAWLDALSQASMGEPFTTDGLLPFTLTLARPSAAPASEAREEVIAEVVGHMEGGELVWDIDGQGCDIPDGVEVWIIPNVAPVAGAATLYAAAPKPASETGSTGAEYVEVGQIDEVQPFMGSGVAHYFFRKDRLPKGTKVYIAIPTQDDAHGGRG